METKIIFDTGEETSPSEILENILKKNGVEDPLDDLLNTKNKPKITVVYDGVKALFKKDITEQQLAEIIQKEYNISSENCLKIITNIKTDIIPFGKEVSIPEDPLLKNISTEENQKIPISTETPEKPKETQKQSIKKTQSSTPDKYRESI